MKQLKQMYLGLQEICLELKRMGPNNDDVSGSTSRRMSLSESIDSRADAAPLLSQSKRHGAIDYASYNSEHGQYQPNRRAKSVPRSRVNWDTGTIKENGKIAQALHGTSWYCPTAALFEEIVQVERVYIRNFVEALIKYEEDRFPKDDFKFELKSDSLRDVIARRLPTANFAKSWHFKFGIEAWLSRIVFKEFGKASVTKSEGTTSKLSFAVVI